MTTEKIQLLGSRVEDIRDELEREAALFEGSVLGLKSGFALVAEKTADLDPAIRDDITNGLQDLADQAAAAARLTRERMKGVQLALQVIESAFREQGDS
jgi:hypothetical protein